MMEGQGLGEELGRGKHNQEEMCTCHISVRPVLGRAKPN